MRRGAFKLAIAFAIAALAVGAFASCGGGDDDSTTTSSSATTPAQESSPGGSATDSANKDGAGDRGSSGGNDGSRDEDDGRAPPSSKASFSNSGGGSDQFREPGGDNSIQEFGEEGDDSNREEAAAALWGYLGARADGDWSKACSYLAKPTLEMLEKLAANSEKLKGQPCPAVLEGFLGELPPGAEGEWTTADVGSLRVEGERGFILYNSVNGSAYFMQLLAEDGTWKIAGLVPVPFPS